MKILSQLTDTSKITEATDKKYVTDAEKTAITYHVHGNITNDGKIGTTTGLMIKTTTGGVLTALAQGSAGQFLRYDGTWGTPPNTVYTHPATHSISEVSGLQGVLDGKVDDSQVLTNVPAGAKFTDTITTINGKTGAIAKADIVALGIPSTDTNTITTINGKTGTILKADIVALGIPAQDTVYTHPTGTNPHGTTKSDVGLSNVTNDKQMPISGGVLENYREKLSYLSGTSAVIDLSLGNVFTHLLTGNTTYTISNVVNGQAHSFTLIINQGVTVRTLTFPSSVKWQGGEIPDLSAASKTYVLTFMTVDGGITWLGMFGGEF